MVRFRPPVLGARQRLNLALFSLFAVLLAALAPLAAPLAGSDLSHWVAVDTSLDSANTPSNRSLRSMSSQAVALSPDGDELRATDVDGEELALPVVGHSAHSDDSGEAGSGTTSAAGVSTTRVLGTDSTDVPPPSTGSRPASGTSGSEPSGSSSTEAPNTPPTVETVVGSTAATEPARRPLSTAAARPMSTPQPTAAGQSTSITPAKLPSTSVKSRSSSTAASSPRASSTTASSTTASTTMAQHHDPQSHAAANHSAALAALRNDNPLFVRFRSVPSEQLSMNALTESAPRPDNGSVGDGQFRVACQYSHFNYDDPIVFPGQPGKAHLHMFFGNTETDANTTVDRLVNSGGGTCNGFELNRSAYWTPALLDGKGNAVVPEKIMLYYKTKFPDRVQPLPQGLKMVIGSTGASFQQTNQLYWSCGSNGKGYKKSNRIPNCGGDVINASIVFPECWDGKNLDSADHRSHLKVVAPEHPCPASHPVRLPQISILLYFPGQSSIDGWHLSSDLHHGAGSPGGSLHADWFGGWNDDAVRLWSDGCMVGARNCSFGQTGTDRQLASLNPLQNYSGPYLLPLEP